MSKADRLDKLQHKLHFYISGMASFFLPAIYYVWKVKKLKSLLGSLSQQQLELVNDRVAYYNKLNAPIVFSDKADCAGGFSKKGKNSSYYFDLKRLLRFFPSVFKFDFVFGDVIDVPEYASFVKSRPISNANRNSIILKLDSVRHYYTIKDAKSFSEKIPKLVWRGAAHQPFRLDFIMRYYNSDFCDVGDVSKISHGKPWSAGYLSVQEQLNYKYVLSMEGYDVATNLKWIMSSNSLCFMRKPRFETWFMEGRLIPGVHYVLLKDDHSDFEEKIHYYEQHPEEAELIISNARKYVEQFYKKDQELLISLMVMNKYFYLTGQQQGNGF